MEKWRAFMLDKQEGLGYHRQGARPTTSNQALQAITSVSLDYAVHDTSALTTRAPCVCMKRVASSF
jgi:hypothetical protein